MFLHIRFQCRIAMPWYYSILIIFANIIYCGWILLEIVQELFINQKGLLLRSAAITTCIKHYSKLLKTKGKIEFVTYSIHIMLCGHLINADRKLTDKIQIGNFNLRGSFSAFSWVFLWEPKQFHTLFFYFALSTTYPLFFRIRTSCCSGQRNSLTEPS